MTEQISTETDKPEKPKRKTLQLVQIAVLVGVILLHLLYPSYRMRKFEKAVAASDYKTINSMLTGGQKIVLDQTVPGGERYRLESPFPGKKKATMFTPVEKLEVEELAKDDYSTWNRFVDIVCGRRMEGIYLQPDKPGQDRMMWRVQITHFSTTLYF